MRFKVRPRCIWLLLVLVTGGCAAHATAQAPLGKQLDAVFDDDLLASACVGASVVVTETGQVLYERNAERAFVPASNMKLVTSLAALALLGTDFRYITDLCADSPANRQGWIVGDLYVRGSGDPTLTHEDLDDLAAQVAEQGLARITGNVVADDTCFSGPPLGDGWAWDNETYAYQAQISGLTVDGNAVRATVEGGSQPGAPCRLSLEPPSAYLKLDPSCITGESGIRRPIVFRRRAQNVVSTTGPVPADEQASARVTVEDPALYAATLLNGYLLRQGILTSGGVLHGKTPASAVVIARHSSLPLRDIVKMMNKPSDNNIAEALLRTIPLNGGRPASAREGSKIVNDWLQEIGIDTQPLCIRDGSGLSRLDLLTPKALVALLRYAAREPKLRLAFVDSLPIAGVDGTLRRRMIGTSAEGVVRAKTGTLLGVCTLSGYVDGREECILTFSLLINNHTCGKSAVRRLQDRACAILAEYARGT